MLSDQVSYFDYSMLRVAVCQQEQSEVLIDPLLTPNSQDGFLVRRVYNDTFTLKSIALTVKSLAAVRA
jgi:hypothetical protein